VAGETTRTFPIDVTANDTDPEGDELTVLSCSASAQGVDVKLVNNMCQYRHPDPDNWTVADMFTYVVSDGHGGTATATVTVTPR
jgi:hypothetical protein